MLEKAKGVVKKERREEKGSEIDERRVLVELLVVKE